MPSHGAYFKDQGTQTQSLRTPCLDPGSRLGRAYFSALLGRLGAIHALAAVPFRAPRGSAPQIWLAAGGSPAGQPSRSCAAERLAEMCAGMPRCGCGERSVGAGPAGAHT
eukprot:357578-Chlamydomonas_euryale.AAC.1